MTVWQAGVEVPKAAVPAVEAFFESLAPEDNPPTISSFELGIGDRWKVDVIFPAPLSEEDLRAHITDNFNVLGFTADALSYEPVAAIDWVAEALKHHQTVHAGRYFVYGSHHQAPRAARYSIKVDANVAFGTGQHETTLGCLKALDGLAKRFAPEKILDVGCGTGILAIAAAKSWACPILATDIDPDAVRVTKDNTKANGEARQIRSLTAPGLDHAQIRARGPYDLITANILAGPLRQLAPDLARALAPGGMLVLSGFLRWQETSVFMAYRNRGLFRHRRIVEGDWVTLMLART